MGKKKSNDSVIDVNAIISFIYNLDDEEILDRISYAVRYKRDIFRSAAKNRFDIGDNVKFTVTRGRNRGRVIKGRVVKINPKTIKVMTYDGLENWRVGPTLLDHDEDPRGN